MELNILKSWLFEAADILRGPVDQSDYKAYIFPLLFLKRISDVYDEERNEALEEYGEDFNDEHRFVIPEGCHWEDIRQTTTNVGNKLQISMRNIESSNPYTLHGIFGDTQWTNKDKLSDALLMDLIEHFSEKNLGNRNVNPSTMGDAYEFLIERFADLSNKKAGEFYTPRSVVRLMTMILAPKEKMSIYDPACGTGGMLLEAIDYLKKQDQEFRNLKLYGNEKNLTTASIARINMFLHDITDFEIVRADTLRYPTFFENDSLKKFDLVIANPPFSLKNWGRNLWSTDQRNSIGVLPPESNGDFAWILHMLNSLKDDGKMAVVLPHGVLYRAGAEQKIRRYLLENDFIEAVIGLGPNLFYGTSFSACIIVINKRKESSKINKVQFIDASKMYKAKKSQNVMLDDHVTTTFNLYNSYRNKENLSLITDLESIKENNYNLNLSLYISPLEVLVMENLQEAYNKMNGTYLLSKEADNKLIEMLLQLEEF